MAKNKSAPGYATGNYDTGGLFGSSTTNAHGTTFKPNESMTQAGDAAWKGFNNSLASLGVNDYANDPNFQVYQDNFNRNAQNSYETNVLNPIQSQGLMRTSGLQAATNSFNETLNNNIASLYDSYYNRQANNLSAYQNSLNSLYNWLTGVNAGSQQNAQNLNAYNQWKYQQDLANSKNNMASIGNTLSGAMSGALSGSQFGPWGALAGGLLGGAGGYLKG